MHKYRLSLSQFTETVTIESATGATFAAQKQESPDAKVSCLSKEYMYAIMQINLWLYKSEFIMVMYIAGLQKIIQLDNLEGGI